MRQGYTHIAIVLDRSGSMNSVREDTRGGFNTFLNGQKAAPGEATLTLVLFDHEYQLVHDQMDIKAVSALAEDQYVPRGTTALLDAVGRTIEETGKKLKELDEKDRPEKVLFVIITDGFENASSKYRIEKVNKLIEHQRSAYHWQFVFLGANQDAITSACAMGIGSSSTMTYAANTVGTQSAWASNNVNTLRFRAAASVSQMDAFYTDADRDAQTAAGVDPSLNVVPPDDKTNAA